MRVFLIVKVADVNGNPLNGCSVNVTFPGFGPGLGTNNVAASIDPVGCYEVEVPVGAVTASVSVERQPLFMPARQDIVLKQVPGGGNPTVSFTGHGPGGFQELNTLRLGGSTRDTGDLNIEIYFCLGQLADITSDVHAIAPKLRNAKGRKIVHVDPVPVNTVAFTGLEVLDPGGSGWAMFRHRVLPTAPSGKLFWVSRVETPKLIAVYVPPGVTVSRQRNNVDPRKQPLDFHLMYHPSPGVLSGPYPLSFDFIDLVCRYLIYWPFKHKSMAAQHQASGARSILVFPVGNPSGWNGTFGGQTSILRLLQEVAFFVQRRAQIPIPLQPVGRCAISGFSASGQYVHTALVPENQHFDRHVLREIYGFDLRGVNPQTFASSVRRWWSRNGNHGADNRAFRLYTTDGSWWNAIKEIDNSVPIINGPSGSFERASASGSAVYVPVHPFWTSLNPLDPPDKMPEGQSKYQVFQPVFDDVHQIIPAIFLQHALSNSKFK